jgi:TRAP-type C4-dicarboxylate transport system permease small subunit
MKNLNTDTKRHPTGPKPLSFLEHVIGIILFIIFALVLVQVIMRFVFGNPLTWSEELSRYLLIWLTFLGGTVVTRQRSHLEVGANLTAKLSLRGQHIANLVITLLIFFVLCVLLKEGISLAKATMSYDAVSIPIPMGFVWLALPVNAALMIRYLLGDTLQLIKAIKE